MRRMLLGVAVLAVLGGLLPSAAAAALTATRLRIGDHPAFVRVVVDFAGGTLRANHVVSPDPSPYDGRARVRVGQRHISTTAAPLVAQRVHARVVQRAGAILLRLRAGSRRFKYLEHTVLHSPERLVVDLWKARPPSPAAELLTAPQGSCLTLQSYAAAPGRVTARGREQDLFEHMFQVNVRNRRGKIRHSRSVTASAGHWHTSVSYGVSRQQAGTLEAVDLSEQDGSLVCIVQVRVMLQPGP